MLKLAGIVIMTMSGALATTAAFADHGDNFGGDRFFGDDHRGDHDGFHMTAPEIDPSSAMSALTLLAGGLTVLRARYSKK